MAAKKRLSTDADAAVIRLEWHKHSASYDQSLEPWHSISERRKKPWRAAAELAFAIALGPTQRRPRKAAQEPAK